MTLLGTVSKEQAKGFTDICFSNCQVNLTAYKRNEQTTAHSHKNTDRQSHTVTHTYIHKHTHTQNFSR